MTKKYFVVTVPENGWSCVVGIYLASNKEKVWENLASQNIGDTVKKLKKENHYIIHEPFILNEL